MAKNEIAKVQEADLPMALDFSADAGAGFEEADQKSYAIPFLRVLQSGSPQVKKSDGAYIKGAEEGFLFNTVTGEVVDGTDGITIVPCHYSRNYLEWSPRESGGGLIATHDVAEGEEILRTCHKGEKGEDLTPEGNVIQDVRNHYVLVVKKDGGYEPALLSLSTTQIKKSKKWMSLMRNIRIQGQPAPMFSQQYKLTTVPESNDKGSWFGVKFEHIGSITSAEIYQAAKDFRNMVRSGAVKAADAEDEGLPY